MNWVYSLLEPIQILRETSSEFFSIVSNISYFNSYSFYLSYLPKKSDVSLDKYEMDEIAECH